MSKIRILHCLETVGSGGVEQRRLLIAKNLQNSPFEMRIVCSKFKDNFDARFNAYGVDLVAIGELTRLTNMGYYRRLIKAVKTYKPDVIHGAVFEGNISAVVAGIVCKVPVVILEETSDPQNRSWKGNLLLRLLCRFADFIVAISPSVHQYLEKKISIDADKLRLVTNGIALSRIPSADEVQRVRDAYDIKDSDFIVGSVGRLRDFHKRFSDLIKAVSLLKGGIPNIKLVIVGDGPDRSELTRLTEDLNVQNNVVFAGYQSDTSTFYSCMNVFSLVSHMEGFGLVVIEAMMFGLPVIATAVGGINDIVVPGETGFLVQKSSPQDIAQAIQKLHDDPKLGSTMGKKGRERAITSFSEEAYIAKVTNLYNEASVRLKKQFN